jgi:hypothetical protein
VAALLGYRLVRSLARRAFPRQRPA